MPVIHSTIPSPYQTITRPVIMGVMDRLKKLTGIEYSKLVLPNGDMVIPPPNTTLDEKDIYSEFGDRSKVFIEASEEIMPEFMQITSQYDNETVRFYNDTALKCFFAPIIQKMKVTLNVKYRAENRSNARSWVNTMTNKIKNDSLLIDNTVDFTFILPSPIVELLTEVYNRREAVEPYGDTLPQYIRKHFTPNFTILTNMADQHKTPAIRYVQPLVRGVLDISEAPTKVRAEVGDTWEMDFNYTFYYEKPVSVYSRFSPMIHSQLLPKHYLPAIPIHSQLDMKTIDNKSIHHLKRIAQGTKIPGWAIEGYCEQDYDDWLPEYRQKLLYFNYRTLVTIDDDGYVIDLNNVGNYKLTETAKAYLRIFHEEATKLRRSLVFVILYEDGNQVPQDMMTLTPDLKVYYSGPVDKRKVYRLVLATMMDPRHLMRPDWDKHEEVGDIIGWNPVNEQLVGGIFTSMIYEIIAHREAGKA